MGLCAVCSYALYDSFEGLEVFSYAMSKSCLLLESRCAQRDKQVIHYLHEAVISSLLIQGDGNQCETRGHEICVWSWWLLVGGAAPRGAPLLMRPFGDQR